DLEWSEDGVEGSNRFVNRVWRLALTCMETIRDIDAYKGAAGALKANQAKQLYIKANQTIQKVTADIDTNFHFNTAIAAVMELVNAMYTVELETADDELKSVVWCCLENVLLLLSPIIPHFCEEVFARMGNQGSILEQPWPEFRKDSMETDEVLVVVQVNGKLRAKFNMGTDAGEDDIKSAALEDARIVKYVEGKEIRKIIVIRKKQTLVNIVV
ncbi:MAG: class I tRNA ligase family protein, partial [Desulfobacterales bacterium]|nr:class I tRNA ligase family protein [Desulfobacterales bacterium]